MTLWCVSFPGLVLCLFLLVWAGLGGATGFSSELAPWSVLGLFLLDWAYFTCLGLFLLVWAGLGVPLGFPVE